jgi:hypothetical protein
MECSPDEARKKICPVLNYVDKCISTGCMAWHETSIIGGYCELCRKGGK